MIVDEFQPDFVEWYKLSQTVSPKPHPSTNTDTWQKVVYRDPYTHAVVIFGSRGVFSRHATCESRKGGGRKICYTMSKGSSDQGRLPLSRVDASLITL